MGDKYTITLPTFDICLSSNGRHEVSVTSPFEIRKALEQFARYFKLEFHYDDIQYYADEHDEECIGFLFTESALDIITEDHKQMPTRCSGGCCFRREQFEDGCKWVLFWVWIHPFFRNRGILTKHWKKFLEQFGEFIIEQPLSDAMRSFLEKKSNKYTEHT